MKKCILLLFLFLPVIIFASCSSEFKAADDIYTKIHAAYYDINSYEADCLITSHTTGGENTYEYSVKYQKDSNTFYISSDGMTIELSEDKTIVSKGDSSIETSSENEDMPIFINTFFKSYYLSESTSLSVSSGEKTSSVLLECDMVNSTSVNSHMKLWINKKSVKPEKMHIFDSDGILQTEVVFKKFEFSKD